VKNKHRQKLAGISPLDACVPGSGGKNCHGRGRSGVQKLVLATAYSGAMSLLWLDILITCAILAAVASRL
jgi:hypothetical protein